MAQMTYPFYIVLALLPSIIWLFYYLRKDVHPEPKRLVLKIFLWGMLAAFPALLIEIGAKNLIIKLDFSLLSKIFYWFLGVALVEEFLKYLVVRDKILKDPEFDEPVDAMVYLLISGLGFAALENVLIFLYQKLLFLSFEKTLILLIFRFFSATFLHALCSALVGYFLALYFFKKRGLDLLGFGLAISTLLHGFYNFSIMETEGNLRIVIPIIILISLAFLVSLAFKRLKKMEIRRLAL